MRTSARLLAAPKLSAKIIARIVLATTTITVYTSTVTDRIEVVSEVVFKNQAARNVLAVGHLLVDVTEGCGVHFHFLLIWESGVIESAFLLIFPMDSDFAKHSFNFRPDFSQQPLRHRCGTSDSCEGTPKLVHIFMGYAALEVSPLDS